MATTDRRVSRSCLAARLGLYGPDLTPRPCSRIVEARTAYFNRDGEEIASVQLSLCPITGSWDATYFIRVETDVELNGELAHCM